MALHRSVIALDRAKSPLCARFLARSCHFCRQIGFIYESVPWTRFDAGWLPFRTGVS